MMKICASVGSVSEMSNIGNSNLVEIRVGNIFQELPKNIDRPVIVRVRTYEQMDKYAKEKIDGYLDIGTMKVPSTHNKIIASYHDDVRTGSSNDIADMLNSFDCEIAKGVYRINRPSDLLSIYDASKNIRKKHVLLGLGEMGVVTRLRPNILGNEFTYAHTGTKTAEGQMSTEELAQASDDSTILGLLGHPLNNSESKKMFTSVFKELGMNAFYLNFDSMTAEGFDEVMRIYGIKGLNVGMPFKNDMAGLVDSLDKSAEDTSSVNTILNSGSKLIGSNTNVDGMLFAMKSSGLDVNGMRALVVGAGGMGRACAYALINNGAEVDVSSRNFRSVNEMVSKMGCGKTDGKDLSPYDLIVNCTPVSMYTESTYPIDAKTLTAEHTVLEMNYNVDSPLLSAAKMKGCRMIPGQEVILGGCMRSFEIWTGKTADEDVFRRSLI